MCDCINKKYTTSVISRKEFQEALCCMLNQITEADTNSTYTFVDTDTIDFTTVLDSVTNNTVVSSRRRQTVLPLSNLTSTAVVRSSDITDDGKVIVLNSGTDVSSEYLYTLPEITQSMIDDGWFVDVVIESGNKVTIKTDGTDIFRNHTQLSADDTDSLFSDSNLPFNDIQSIRQFRFVAVEIDGVKQWIEVKKEIPQEVDTSIFIENTLFVMKNGNDTTALPNRLDLPYASVRTAMGAASSGDTVIVYPGEYNYTYTNVQLNTDEASNNNDLTELITSYGDAVNIENYYILKSDVNLHMYKGAVINITGLSDMASNYSTLGNTEYFPEFPIKFGETKHGITGNGEIHFDLTGQLAPVVYMYMHKSASSVMELDYFSIKSDASKAIALTRLDNAALATHNFNFKFLEFEEVSWKLGINSKSVNIDYNIEDFKFDNTVHDSSVFIIETTDDELDFSNINFNIDNVVGSHTSGNASLFSIKTTKANVTVDIKNLDLKDVNTTFRILTLEEIISNLNFQVHNFRTSGRLLDHNNPTSLMVTPDSNTIAYIKLHGVILNTSDEVISSSIDISTLNSETLTLDLDVVDRRSIDDITTFIGSSSGFTLINITTVDNINVTITGKYTYSPVADMNSSLFSSLPANWDYGIVGKNIDSEGALLRDFVIVYKGLETTPAVTDFPSLVYTSTPSLGSLVDYDLINVFSNTDAATSTTVTYNLNLDSLRTDLKVK